MAGAVSESELYSGMGSLQARREGGASVRALLRLRWPRVKRSRGGETTCDGWVAGSHAVAHGDVEFELEVDPSSKSACWSKSEISPNLPASLRTMCGSRTGGWLLPCVMSD
jgi:hypothetical protein